MKYQVLRFELVTLSISTHICTSQKKAQNTSHEKTKKILRKVLELEVGKKPFDQCEGHFSRDPSIPTPAPGLVAGSAHFHIEPPFLGAMKTPNCRPGVVRWVLYIHIRE